MKDRTTEHKILETIFWIVVSPIVSVIYVATAIVIGLIEAAKSFFRFAKDYTDNLLMIWKHS